MTAFPTGTQNCSQELWNNLILGIEFLVNIYSGIKYKINITNKIHQKINCRYLRLQCKEAEDILFIGSKHREAVMNFVPMPKSCTEALKILADETDKEYPVFRNKGKTQTIATGSRETTLLIQVIKLYLYY